MKETPTQCYITRSKIWWINVTFLYNRKQIHLYSTLIVNHRLQSLFKTWKNKKVHSPLGYSLTHGDLALTIHGVQELIIIKKFSGAIFSPGTIHQWKLHF